MTEREEVLVQMLQFMHPGTHPKLDEIPTSLLVDLAEAVEKWKVVTAQEACRLAMRYVQRHPRIWDSCTNATLLAPRSMSCPFTYFSMQRTTVIMSYWRKPQESLSLSILGLLRP